MAKAWSEEIWHELPSVIVFIYQNGKLIIWKRSIKNTTMPESIMEITFSSPKIAKLCNTFNKMRAELDEKEAKVLAQRLTQMAPVETLEDLRKLPGRCHELTGDRKGQLAMDLVHPRRLIFVPDHDPVPEKPDGGLDWQQVAKVTIVEIGDYH